MNEPVYPSRVTRIDIEEELKAAERGECLLCRIKARHPDDTECPNGLEINKMWDHRSQGCDSCNDFIPGWFFAAGSWINCPHCNPDVGHYISIENEPVVRHPIRGRWEYVRNTATNDRRYLHMDCDSLTTNQGYCIMCGAPCPTLWTGGF